MGKKLTYEEVKEYVESNGYKLISKEYVNNGEKLKMICDKGHECEISFSKFKSGRRCRKCANEKIRKRMSLNIEETIKFIEKEGYEVLSEFKDAKEKIHLKCPEGHDLYMNWNNFKSGKRCKKCDNLRKINSKETIEKFIKEHNYTLLSEYINQREPLKLKCNVCGNIFYKTFQQLKLHPKCNNCLDVLKREKYKEILLSLGVTPIDIPNKYSDEIEVICKNGHRVKIKFDYLIANNGRCKNCKITKGEEKITEWLKSNNVKYIFQHTFKDCKYKQVLFFDFYLPDYNLIIEYNGIQHYEIVEHFGGKDYFNIRVEKDKIKKEYCENNGINFLEIPYWEYDKIDDILNRICFQRLSLK